ncbi:MAG: 1-aminocyclopropane-1-carboxylate deaminase [Flavobacteriaceae bacterium]|jgi:1-aminocyclopropane-1-carboxylate deaminase|tara:strand:- start:10620 stop:11552 length:933 start_codon:yes stop_codon:yes gene_type:complete
MQIFDSFKSSVNQSLDNFHGHKIVLKREDLIHPIVSGNKFRKLKYIFQKIKTEEVYTLLTFGGAFSNHLSATAAAGKIRGVRTIGIVRGEEWQQKIFASTTLTYCASQGMELHCVSRAIYDQKERAKVVEQMCNQIPTLRIIPEGGTEPLAIKGCQEILQPEDADFEVICSSVGTGGTLAGLINSSSESQNIVGFNALKNTSIVKTIEKLTNKKNWTIENGYTFGGFAKINKSLISFMNDFYNQYKIPLDPIYTGKLLFGIFELIKQDKWLWGKKILVIHTGGLQGVKGMNAQLQKKGNPQLLYGKNLPS